VPVTGSGAGALMDAYRQSGVQREYIGVSSTALYLQLLNSPLTGSAGATDLNKVSGVDVGKLFGVGRLANAVVRARAGELNLGTGASLKLVEVLSPATDECTMLSSRDLDTENDSVAQFGDDLLKLSFDFCDELRLTTQMDLIEGLARTGATVVC
jgi:hypothetical protein